MLTASSANSTSCYYAWLEGVTHLSDILDSSDRLEIFTFNEMKFTDKVMYQFAKSINSRNTALNCNNIQLLGNLQASSLRAS